MSKDPSMQISLPVSAVEPCNGRIYAIAIAPRIQTSETGLILSTDKVNEKGRSVQLHRYFAIAVAKDVNIGRNGKWWKKTQIKRGTEVFPFLPVGIESYAFPVIKDWVNNGREYCVFHESELMGYDNVGINQAEKMRRSQKWIRFWNKFIPGMKRFTK